MMTTKERNVTLMVRCTLCNTDYKLKVAEEDYIEYTRPNRRNIQDIFPYLTPSERELLISHTCEECWNKMFGEPEELFEDTKDIQEPREIGEQPTEKYLTMDEVIDVIRDLAKSQGFYGRLLESILDTKEKLPENYEEYKTIIENAKLKDTLDVVFYFES